MKAITLRGIDDATYEAARKLSEETHTSINKLIIHLLREKVGVNPAKVNRDFDDFFGSWNEKQYKDFMKSTQSLRKIDKELWD